MTKLPTQLDIDFDIKPNSSKVVKGDLIKLARQGEFDVIVHGCNCFHTMGAGIAVQIARQYPEVAMEDKIFSKLGDHRKLGNFTRCVVSGEGDHTFTVVNAYTQFGTGSGKQVEYMAIRAAFKAIAREFDHDVRIGYPQIGAGLAGGDWKIISEIINTELNCHNHTLVMYDPTA